ncbi:glycosyltransferase [Saccharibacter sp. 17.LH.SD]|nr:glycosyltransferase [Saccharibacter sp. 17.LH.SD]
MPQRSLKIVHVGDFFSSLKKRSPSQFSVGGKLSNGLIRNGHHVINFAYRDIARAEGWFNSRYLGKRALWRALKSFMETCRPDILLLGHGYMIPPEIILDIRRAHPGLTTIQWNIDALFVEDNVRDFVARHHVVDASFISTAGSLVRELIGHEGIVGFLPNPVDWSVERGRAHEHAHLEADLFYACGNPARLRRVCGRDWEMNEFCQELEQHLPRSMKFSYAGVRGAPYYSGVDYAHLLEGTTMGLNISRRADYFLYSSDRLAHMIGNGQLIHIERQTGYDHLFSDHEMSFFSSFDELVDNITRYHKAPQERQKVAEAGWRRYHELFNERRVAEYIIHTALGGESSQEFPWASCLS